MKNVKYAWILVITLITLQVNAQKSKSPYTIKGHVEGLKDTVVYLAHYYGKQLFYNDTARVNNHGDFEFEGKPFEECGRYAISFPGSKLLEFIADYENIEFSINNEIDPTRINVIKSKTNKIFFDYIKFINEKIKARAILINCANDSLKSEEERGHCRSEIEKLNTQVTDYQWSVINSNPDNLLSKYFKMEIDVIPPVVPDSIPESNKYLWQSLQYRKHYWDNTDLSDSRIIRNPKFHQLLDNYLTKVIFQIPDTMITEVNKLIRSVENNAELFKYITQISAYNAETSKIMCMDKVFVNLVDNYYLSGKATWASEKNLKDMKDAADKKRNCLCGSIAPDIILLDTTEQKWVSMHKNRGKYTLLVIWESNCGHCKKEVPELLEVYHKWKDKGFVVYAVGNDLENEGWLKFVREKKLDWINVSDTKEIMTNEAATALISQGKTSLLSLNYRTTWDVSSTPKVYLMDENMKIIAKSIGHEQIDALLAHLIDGKDLDAKSMKNEDYEDEHAPQPKGKKAGK